MNDRISIESIKLKFTSGNSVPVTRAALTDKEFDFMLGEIQKLTVHREELLNTIKEVLQPIGIGIKPLYRRRIKLQNIIEKIEQEIKS